MRPIRVFLDTLEHVFENFVANDRVDQRLRGLEGLLRFQVEARVRGDLARHPDLWLEIAAVGKVEHVGGQLILIVTRLDGRSQNGGAVQHLVLADHQIDEAPHALNGGESLVPENLEHVRPLAAVLGRRGNPCGFGVAERFDEPANFRLELARFGLAAGHGIAEGGKRRERILSAAGKPTQDAFHDFQIVAGNQHVVFHAINGPAGWTVVVLGNVEHGHFAAVRFGDAAFALVGRQVFGHLFQQSVRFLQVPLDVGDQHEGRFGLARLEQGHGHFAGGHAVQILPGEPDLPVRLVPFVLDLGAEVLDKRLHDRIGHELTDLRLVPLGTKVIDVANRQKAFGRNREQSFASGGGQERTTTGQRQDTR